MGRIETLADRIVAEGLATASDLDRAREVQMRTGARFAATLARLGLVSEDDLAAILSTTTGCALVPSTSFPDEPVLMDRLNLRFLSRRSLLPLEDKENRLTVAMADPGDADALAALEFATGLEIVPVVATFSDIADKLSKHLPTIVEDAGVDGDTSGLLGDIERLQDEESDAPVIRLVQRLLAEAVQRRASDIHVEPMARYVAVRYRIDGQLLEVEKLSDQLGAPIARRIKVMAGLDIAEARLPQDGRLRTTVRGRDVDVRVATSPTAWGESIVLRLLARTEVPLDLEQLGLPSAAFDRLAAALDRPHGIILLTGPTGSGKTTTLYASLTRLRRPEVKILTVEDPVEILIEGVNQVQVRPEIGLSYAATLRAFLRQDPNILMIGEIRDQETAEIAMRAALTGHLVLSTLHTNSAIGAFTRLADIGVEPYLTASTVIAAVAQRLIRALCTACTRVRPVSDAERDLFQRTGLEIPSSLHDPVGCRLCQHSGYVGRIPIIEVVEVDDDLRNAIRAGLPEGHDSGHVGSETLLGHGLMLAAAGRTTLSEVQRAVALA